MRYKVERERELWVRVISVNNFSGFWGCFELFGFWFWGDWYSDLE